MKCSLTIARLSIVLLAACSSAMRQGAQGAPSRSRDESVITTAELREATVGSLFDYIQSRRPRWLERSHARAFRADQIAGVAVFVDNQLFGGPEALRQIPLTSAVEVHYYGPSDAQARFGVGYLNGVIQVISRTSD